MLKEYICLTGLLAALLFQIEETRAVETNMPVGGLIERIAPEHAKDLPSLTTTDPKLDQAFVIALSDISGNIHPYNATAAEFIHKSGLPDDSAPVMVAGGDYHEAWTRDTAINAWNGGGILWPEVTRNTLLSVLEYQNGKLVAGDWNHTEYWDAIIWATGAWNYYLYTGDRAFLSQAFEVTTNTLAMREADEFDPKCNLFRGPYVYGDGVAAYPDRYGTTNNGWSSAIVNWPTNNPQRVSSPGYGLPMFTLSTCCTYLHTYELLTKMATTLGRQPDPAWLEKAAQMRTAINSNFWNANLGRYIGLVDPWGTDERQEAVGLAFSVLFGVADHERQESLFRHTVITPNGIACLWPNYPRYAEHGGVGRHSGTVWPFAEGFWGDAAAQIGHADIFAFELTQMAEKAVRDGQFYELYHPITGLPYGWLQEEAGHHGLMTWDSVQHQTWSATAYLRLILFDLVGMRFDESGIVFAPLLPDDIHKVDLTGLRYRNAFLDIHISGSGSHIIRMTVNGERARDHRLPVTATGHQQIEIKMGHLGQKEGD
jgi:glycogen debranching enzyme